MSKILICGICCMLVSGWGIIQLLIMGVICYIEAPIFLEESMPEEYEDYKDFISQTKTNFRTVTKWTESFFLIKIPTMFGRFIQLISWVENLIEARLAFNCWIAAGMYIGTLLMSYMCIKKAKSDAAERAQLNEDDELICNPDKPKNVEV